MQTSLEKDYNPGSVVEDIVAEHNNGVSFQESISLSDTIQRCTDFYEGRQWGNVSGKTKALPRATFNMTEMIVNNKVAGILAQPLKVVFQSSDMPDLARKLTDFHESIEKEMGVDGVYEECVNRAAVEGCAFLHFYWDGNAVGMRGEFKGGMRAEMIEARAVTVQNPLNESIQQQKWVIIESRYPCGEVIAMCEDERQRALIVPDNNDLIENSLIQEQQNSGMVTVYTRYFRKDNEVFFEKATKAALVQPARSLNPDVTVKALKRRRKKGEEEYEEERQESAKENEYHAFFYPIEVYQYKSRKNSIYGRGEVEPIIPNNRTVNFNAAMMSKSVEDQGFGTIVAKEGALPLGAKITNDPSKVLIDKYRGNGNGFYMLNKAPFNAATFNLNDNIMNMTRTVTGSTEVMTGEVLGKNQSGTSIAYLQQQAQKPIDKLAKRYKKFRENVARVEAQFYVLYYEDKQYETEISVAELREAAMTEVNNGTLDAGAIARITQPEKIKDVFNGREFRNTDFDIMIESGAASQYSEIAELQLLDNLLAAKYIDIRMFLKAYPSTLLPNKEEILDELDAQEQSQVNVLSQQLAQAQEQLAQAQEVMKRQGEIVNNILGTIQENSRLKATLAKLQAEYAAKINEANSEILAERNAAQTMADIIHAGAAQTPNSNARQ